MVDSFTEYFANVGKSLAEQIFFWKEDCYCK